MKACSKCGVVTDDFGPDFRAKDLLQSSCRSCYKAFDLVRYQKKRLQKCEYQRRYYANLSAEERSIRSRRHYLKANYGLSVEEYEAMLSLQNGLCALCLKPPSGRRMKVLQVDHCHKTGRVRGLLCNECNTAIGRLGDSEEGIRRTLEYLTKSDVLVVDTPQMENEGPGPGGLYPC